MEMREGGKSLKGIAAELNSLRIRQRRGGDQLDSKCRPLGLAMVAGRVSQSEKMEQVRAAI